MAGAGWWPDPTGRYVYRYYDGAAWTEHVSDANGTSTDPIAPGPLGQQLLPTQDSLKAETLPAVPVAERVQDSFQKLSRWSDKQMNQAARWLNKRSPTGGGSDDLRVLETQPGDAAILGQWSGLATSVANFGMATSGIVGGDDIMGVLHAVSGSVDAQEQLLRSIDSKLDALVKGPFNTGITHLREAERVTSDADSRLEHIKRAKDCLYLAHGQAASVQSRALVEYHLGLVWLLLERPDDAIHWMAQSHSSCMLVASEFARQTKHVKVLRSPTSTAAAAAFYPAGIVVLGMKLKNMVVAERARDMLTEFLPFLGCVARSHNLLARDSDEQLPALILVSLGGDSYELIPTTIEE